MTQVGTTSQEAMDYFVSLVQQYLEIKRVWVLEEAFLRVRTLIDNSDRRLEGLIHQAQIEVMKRFPGLNYDFVVLFLQGSPVEHFTPKSAKILYTK